MCCFRFGPGQRSVLADMWLSRIIYCADCMYFSSFRRLVDTALPHFVGPTMRSRYAPPLRRPSSCPSCSYLGSIVRAAILVGSILILVRMAQGLAVRFFVTCGVSEWPKRVRKAANENHSHNMASMITSMIDTPHTSLLSLPFPCLHHLTGLS